MRARLQIRCVALCCGACTSRSCERTECDEHGSRFATGRIVQSIGADNLKPAACAGITLTTLVSGVTGTSGNDLLLGFGGQHHERGWRKRLHPRGRRQRCDHWRSRH